jgi:hypothetical protein
MCHVFPFVQCHVEGTGYEIAKDVVAYRNLDSADKVTTKHRLFCSILVERSET